MQVAAVHLESIEMRAIGSVIGWIAVLIVDTAYDVLYAAKAVQLRTQVVARVIVAVVFLGVPATRLLLCSFRRRRWVNGLITRRELAALLASVDSIPHQHVLPQGNGATEAIVVGGVPVNDVGLPPWAYGVAVGVVIGVVLGWLAGVISAVCMFLWASESALQRRADSARAHANALIAMWKTELSDLLATESDGSTALISLQLQQGGQVLDKPK